MNKETLEEAAELYLVTNGVKYFKQDTISGIKFGAKWQAERMYTEEDIHNILDSYSDWKYNGKVEETYEKWFKKHKK